MNKTIALNRRARHEYFIEKELEAGLVLQGWEVKALRANKANLVDSYVLLKNREAWLLGATITPLALASSHVHCDAQRTRKLLMHTQELKSLAGRIQQAGYTAIALSLYWKGHLAKVKLGLAKGKKLYDKRATLKEREWQLKKSRLTKRIRI